VLEVIETVKRVFGIDFEVAFVGRRAGDPAQTWRPPTSPVL
jgi:UDP-glucose 4-epimerase